MELGKKALDFAELHNGRYYLSIDSFAAITNRSATNVRHLIKHGNRIRRLSCDYILGKPIIPLSEVTEFPFTASGRNADAVYHYTEYGTMERA